MMYAAQCGNTLSTDSRAVLRKDCPRDNHHTRCAWPDSICQMWLKTAVGRTNQPTNHTTQAQVGKLSKDCLNYYVQCRLWGDEMDDILSIFTSINDTRVSITCPCQTRRPCWRKGYAPQPITKKSKLSRKPHPSWSYASLSMKMWSILVIDMTHYSSSFPKGVWVWRWNSDRHWTTLWW